MADTQVKSLVSEQYLDGWSYDDDDDDDETESSRTSQTASHKHQVGHKGKVYSMQSYLLTVYNNGQVM